MSRHHQTAVVNGHLNSLSPDYSPKTVHSNSSSSSKNTCGGSQSLAPGQQQRPHHPMEVVRVPLKKPQISIEEADGPCSPLSPPRSPPYDRLASPTSTVFEPATIGDSRSAPTSPYINAIRSIPIDSGARKNSPQHLTVKKTNMKSKSLPLGMVMNEMGHNTSHSPTDSEGSDETELSPVREALCNGKEHLHVPRKKRSETLDSLYSESDSGTSSEDEKMLPILQTIHDDTYDDVFHDVDIDMGSEVDSKLIDWAFNVFVPACCTLLSRCAEMEAQKDRDHDVSKEGMASLSDCIQTDLRSLSNTINYFCTEQQRLSGLLKAKLSASVSTDRMSKIAIDRAATLQTRQSSSNTSSFSEASSGSFDSHDSQSDRSYAVKILRSVSQSLIAPLLHEAEDGFTHELHKSIIQALQKISWKVEACLSFNDPSKDFEIHAKIFDSERAPGIRAMMIGALPPEGPKLQVVATNASRSNSISSPKRKNNLSVSLKPMEPSESSKVIRRTPSGRRRPSGTVFDTDAMAVDVKAASLELSDAVAEEVKGEEGDKTPVVPGSSDNTPTTPRRMTTSQLEMSPSHRNRYSARIGPAKSIDHDQFDEDDICPQYFRPKAARRTTISLSRKEVTNLGLTVAKRVEESIIHEVGSTECGFHGPPVLTEDDIRRRLHDTLTEEFDRINESTKSSSYFERVRSASMSDLLEDNFDSQTPPRRHDSFQGLVESHSVDNLNGSVNTLDSNDDIVSVSSARIEQSYVPATHHPASSSIDTSCEAEWVYVKRSDMSGMDPRFARQSSIQSEPATPLKKDKKGKAKNKNVDKVKRTLTGSGKFTGKLLKTAQALRRASVASKPKKGSATRVKLEDQLCDPVPNLEFSSPLLKQRTKHSKSEPPSPIPQKQAHYDTMPASKSKHKSLKRFMAKKSKSFNSKDSLGRKIRGKSEFLQDYESEMERECRLSFNESIENYSKIAVKPRASEGKQLI